MIYAFSDTVPANTPKANKRRTVMKLGRGIIHDLEVEFPPGCAALAHCTINEGGHQIWPTNEEESFHSDGWVIKFREHYELKNPPYELGLWTWNEDDTYEHTITVRIGLLEKKYVMPWSLADVLRRLLGI